MALATDHTRVDVVCVTVIQRVVRGALPVTLAELPNVHVKTARQVEVLSLVGAPVGREDVEAEFVTAFMLGGGRNGGRCSIGGRFRRTSGGKFQRTNGGG